MFTSIVTTVPDVLFTTLDPHHIGNLRMVSRAFAKCITLAVCDKIKKAAMAKYERLVVVNSTTVRIHSRLGKTMIELILPDGNAADVVADKHASIFMRLDGRLYRGKADNEWRLMGNSIHNMSRYMFHNASILLLNSPRVFIVRNSPDLDNRKQIEVYVEGKKGSDNNWTFILRFRPEGMVNTVVCI